MWITVLFAALVAMAGKPVDFAPYLMDEGREVALARSAAPVGVGAAAEVWVLKEHGYRLVTEGTNGFVCVVERSFQGALRADLPPEAVWNPRVKAPICFNEPARPVFERQRRKADWILSGSSVEEVLLQVARAYASGEFRLPDHGAMAYMLSSGQYLGDNVQQGMPHLMFYEPYARAEDFGGRAAGRVAFVLHGGGTPESVVVVPVPEFVVFDSEGGQ